MQLAYLRGLKQPETVADMDGDPVVITPRVAYPLLGMSGNFNKEFGLMVLIVVEGKRIEIPLHSLNIIEYFSSN